MTERKADGDSVAKDLGYASFKHYLNSPEWKIIKSIILERDAGYCRGGKCCNRTTNVEIIIYRDSALTGYSPYLLITICESCLEKFKKDSNPDAMLHSIMKLDTRKRGWKADIGKWFGRQHVLNQSTKLTIKKALEAHYVPLPSL